MNLIQISVSQLIQNTSCLLKHFDHCSDGIPGVYHDRDNPVDQPPDRDDGQHLRVHRLYYISIYREHLY